MGGGGGREGGREEGGRERAHAYTFNNIFQQHLFFYLWFGLFVAIMDTDNLNAPFTVRGGALCA